MNHNDLQSDSGRLGVVVLSAGYAGALAPNRLQQHPDLDTTPLDAPLCVVGGGLTGIEAAAKLAEQRPDAHIVLLCGGTLGPTLGAKARSSVRRQLEALNVHIDDAGTVAAVEDGRVRLTDGRTMASEATVWTAGFGVPDLATRSGLRTDSLGRLLTDETLMSLDDPRIFATGVAAAPSNLPLRMSCQAAMPLAARASDSILDLFSLQAAHTARPIVRRNRTPSRNHSGIAQRRHTARDVCRWEGGGRHQGAGVPHVSETDCQGRPRTGIVQLTGIEEAR
ncbi:FAD-dependent oxidoreductase [Gordonia terrae]